MFVTNVHVHAINNNLFVYYVNTNLTSPDAKLMAIVRLGVLHKTQTI